MNALSEIAEATAAVTARAGSAVVTIGRDARGSGVIVAPGRVLTNAHNLRGATTTVTLADGTAAAGSVVGVDIDGDLAVLEVDTGDKQALSWRDEDVTVAVGTPLFALANPAGRGLRVTFGTVSAVGQSFRGPRGRRVSGAIEHTAALGRGSSGGPVVDTQGRLLGINTHRLGDGFYLALPADAALRARVDALLRAETPRRARLGVGLAPAHVANSLRSAVGLPQRDGLLVRFVEADSPAARADLRVGDLLVALDGRPLARADDLLDVIDQLEPDATLTLGVVRGAEELTVAVHLGGGPQHQGAA